MRVLLIVYHSRTGGAEHMARAAATAAGAEPDVQVRLLPAADTAATDLIGASGLVFVAPENLAALSGVMKDFFDRTYYDALGQLEGRPYALMVCAGSDGQNAVRQIQRIATGWRLRQVAEPIVVCTGAQTPEAIRAPKMITAEDRSRCATLGAALAAGLAAGIF